MERTSVPVVGADFVDVPPGRFLAGVGGWLWHLHHAGLLPRDREVVVYGKAVDPGPRNPGRWHGQRSCQLIGRRVGKTTTTIGELMDSTIPAGSVYLMCDCMDRTVLRWASEPICGDQHEAEGSAQCSNLAAFKAAGLALQWLRATDEISPTAHIYPQLLIKLDSPPYDPHLHPALRERVEARRALRYDQLGAFADRRDIQTRFIHAVCDKLTALDETGIAQLVTALKTIDAAAVAVRADQFLVEDPDGVSSTWSGNSVEDAVSLRYSHKWEQVAAEWVELANQWYSAAVADAGVDWDEVDRTRSENNLEPLTDRYAHSQCGTLHDKAWQTLTRHSVWVWRAGENNRLSGNQMLMINLDGDAASPVWRIPLAAALLDLRHLWGVDITGWVWRSRAEKLLGWVDRGNSSQRCYVIGADPDYTREAIEMAARVSPEVLGPRALDMKPAERVTFRQLILAADASRD